MRIFAHIIFALTIMTLTACGGGGGGTTPQTPPPSTKATLKINLTGTLPAGSAMAGAGLTLTLPANVIPEMASGAVASTVVTASGVFAGGSVTTPVYVPANGAVPASLQLAVANAVPAGVTQIGEIATVTLQLANGATPAASSFSFSNVSVIDTLGNINSSSMGAAVANVTLQ